MSANRVSRTSVGCGFALLALSLSACATADAPGSLSHDGGGTDAHFDVKPGTDTGELPGDDTAVPDEDSGSGKTDTKGGTDTGGGGTDTSTCTIPTGKVCGTDPQCGCPGKNCDITKVDGTRACVAAGPKKLHGACSAIGDCGAGLSCIAGNCLPFCDSSAGDCSGTCTNIQGGTPASPIPGYTVCFETCDPVSPSAVCGGGNCQLDGAGGTVCTAAGSATGAGGCSTSTPWACAAGYVCLTSNACAKWCRVGFPGDCSTGTCGSLSPPAMVGSTEYGVCP